MYVAKQNEADSTGSDCKFPNEVLSYLATDNARQCATCGRQVVINAPLTTIEDDLTFCGSSCQSFYPERVSSPRMQRRFLAMEGVLLLTAILFLVAALARFHSTS